MRSLPTRKPLASFVMLTLLLMTLVFVFTSSAMGQVVTGNLTGTIVDPQGAVIAGADVTVKSEATGVEKVTKSNGEGIFSMPNLTPGKYSVSVKAPNFTTKTVTGIDVRLGETTDLKVDLTVGGTEASVTVTADTEQIVQKDTAQISSSFETRKVMDLPSNSAGGGIDTLALLAPGVVPGFGNVNSNGVTLSVNGNRARANNFTIDGTDNNDLSIGGPNFFVDNQDVVQEFQVITSNYSAQYGRNQGAIVNIVTKSGGNEYHGSAFEFFRSHKFDAMTNLERRDPGRSARDKQVRNVYGGTFGGPIILPRFGEGGKSVWNGKNRAFFFTSFQMLSDHQNAGVLGGSLAPLPSEFARLKAQYPNNPAINAFVSQSAFAVTALGVVVTPRTDLAQQRICLPKDPTQPVSNGAACGALANDFPVQMAFPRFSWKSPFVEPEFTIRGDVNVTPKDSFYVRYLYQRSDETASLFSNEFLGNIPFASKNLSGNYTRQISSHITNEFRATRQQLFVKFGGGCTDTFTGCILDPADLGKTFTNIGFSGFGASGGSGVRTIGPATNLPQGRLVKVLQFNDNLAWTHGRHSFTMGADLRRLTNSVPFLPNVNGAFAFTEPARLVANAPTRVTIVGGKETLDYSERDQFYYFQDDWKVRDNLTFNLGLRYEYTGQPINLLNEISTARESDPAQALWLQSLPVSARSVQSVPVDKNNWAPRFGFAYAPRWGNGKFARFLFGENDATVIRGGFSIAYDPAFYNILLNVSTSAPMVFNNTVTNNASLTAPSFTLPNNPSGDVVRASLGSFLQRNTFDPRLLNQTIVGNDFHAPYSEQWSFGIQRQINRNNVFEVRYVGNHGVGLFQTVDRNPFLGDPTQSTINGVPNRFATGGVAFGFTSRGNGLTFFTFPAFPQFTNGLTPLSAAQCPDPVGVNNTAACRGRIIPGFSNIRSRDNTATSRYDGLQTRLNGRWGNQLTYGASYTFSKAIDNASEIFSFGESFTAANPLDLNKGEKSLSGFHRKHAFSSNFIWDVPVRKAQNGFVGHVLGGWQLNGTWIVASGRRYTVEQFLNEGIGLASYQDNGFLQAFAGFDAVRPFYGNPNAPLGTVGITDVDAAYFSRNFTGARQAFAASPTGLYSFNIYNTTGQLVPVNVADVRYIFNGPGAASRFGTPFGDVPRNSEVGPRLNQTNFGIFKNTKVGERVTVQLRAEFYNVFNHPNPGYGVAGGTSLPDNILENATSRPTSTFQNFQEISLSSRRVQFGLRIIF